MQEPQTLAALIVSGVSLLGTLVNMWLKLQIRVELLEMKQSIMEWAGEEFARKEDTDRRLDGLEGGK
jgi:hypothetical protein